MPHSRLTTAILSVCSLVLIVITLTIWSPSYHPTSPPPPVPPPGTHPQSPSSPTESSQTSWQKQAEMIIRDAKSFVKEPIHPPYKHRFYDLGQRTQIARRWLEFLHDAPKSEDTRAVLEAVESAIGSMYPYLQNSPKHPGSKTPFTDLHSSMIPGSRGIVIPTGKATMRYATHLIGSLKDVLHSELPVQVVYAGDKDLPAEDRERLRSRFSEVEFLDILSLIDDTTTKLEEGGWAIKAFAALYAPFEQVILLDADCVFVQPPENLFSHPSYASTGALLFHDRLLWQHNFRERHNWWISQIHEPSATLNKSLVWTEDYAEEGDSGVVVVDKSRLDVLMGLLHIAWQNTEAVREEVTYKITYGDKESWWFGFELSGSGYSFERHYATMVGWLRDKAGGSMQRICSFVIGHLDDRDEVLWYNGGLLKNKRLDPLEFGLPTHMMVDGTWEKGATKDDMSCMLGSSGKPLSREVDQILDKSIILAKELDAEFGFV